jgi:P27 family predicted phage terminase small subunit
LAALGVLTEVDEPALQLAAEHYEVAVRAARQLREGSREGSEEEGLRTTAEGLLIEDRDGNVRKNPLLQVLRDHSGALRAYLTEFGMTPSSRSRLHTEPEEQLSLADILFAEVAARAQTQPTEDEG